MAKNVLSFERAFAYRAAALAGYVSFFYLLVEIGMAPALAVGLLAIATGLAAFAICRWREGDDLFDSLAAAGVIQLFCGVVPLMLLDDHREMRVPQLAGFVFHSSACEATFFLAALGALGPKLADPVLAIVAGLTVFIGLAFVLAVATELAKK